MQWIAIITMVIDHVGIVWFSDSSIWRIIGRIAFPVYTYYVALGMTRTRSASRYLTRLGILAVLSQLPFSLLFHTYTINVIGTFFVSVAAIYAMERMPSRPLRYVWPVIAAVLLQAVSFDYGAYGLLLLLIYRYTKDHMMLSAHFGLNLLYFVVKGGSLQLFSILPTFIFAYLDSSRAVSAFRVPRWLWRSFYPGHLLLLYLLAYFIP